ncbi:hypothetical protein PLESTF_000233700 [Pleodorina starrii]|nr:hypothetical protein PLESTF_000233700 [Pleodorina starrii]
MAVRQGAERARAIQKLLLRIKTDWKVTFGNIDRGSVPSAEETELIANLAHILKVADKLLQIAGGCQGDKDTRNYKTGKYSTGVRAGSRDDAGSGGPGGCPAAAPELLQGGTSAFLASLLRTYPRGPTSREALAAWAAAATAFLQQHRELQRQQRQAAAALAMPGGFGDELTAPRTGDTRCTARVPDGALPS